MNDRGQQAQSRPQQVGRDAGPHTSMGSAMGKRSQGVPRDPSYVPSQSGDRLLPRRAENGEMVDYTPAEYGVRKDDGGGLVKPINSSGGLLILAILLTACVGGLIYCVVQAVVTDQWHILGEVWWVFPATLFPFAAAWAGYFTERKAEKLRRARNLPRPIE